MARNPFFLTKMEILYGSSVMHRHTSWPTSDIWLFDQGLNFSWFIDHGRNAQVLFVFGYDVSLFPSNCSFICIRIWRFLVQFKYKGLDNPWQVICSHAYERKINLKYLNTAVVLRLKPQNQLHLREIVSKFEGKRENGLK